MSRVLMAGTLSVPRTVGSDPSAPFLRATLRDPTGTVELTAGSYQPRAVASLTRWADEGEAIVVGRVHAFRGGDGSLHPTVRAEAVGAITPTERQLLTDEIWDQTKRRIELVETIRRAAPIPELDLRRVPPRWLAAARRSVAAYPTAPPGELRSVIDGLHPERISTTVPARPRTPAVAKSAAASPSGAALSAADRAQESAFLDLLDELSDSSADGCADLMAAFQRAAARGVARRTAEELLERLESAGVLEEPVVGRVRRRGPGT